MSGFFDEVRSDKGEAPVASGALKTQEGAGSGSLLDEFRSDRISEGLREAGTMERGGTPSEDLGRLESFGYGAVSGAVMGAEFTGGAAAAFRATPMLPAPARLGATVAGGMGAVVALEPPTKKLLEVAGVPRYEDIPEGYRPAFVAGETFMESLFPAAGMTGLAKSSFRLKGTSMVGSWFNSSLEAVAKQSVKATGVLEAGSAAGAAVGGALAEEYAPGDFKTRFVAETVGGMANPGRWGPELLRWAWYRSKGAVTALAPQRLGGVDPDEMAKTEAARYLKQVFEELDMDAEDSRGLTEILSAEGAIPGATWAQRTGAGPLSVIQKSLEQRSKLFGIEVQKRTEKSLKTIASMVDGLLATGDPQAVVAAAEIQQKYIRTMLDGLVDNAKGQAKIAVANLSPDVMGDKRKISQVAWNTIDEVRKTAREAEKALYASVQRDSVLDQKRINNFVEGVKRIESDLNPEDIANLPPYLKNFVGRMGEYLKTGEGRIAAKEFINFRSAILDLEAGAANANELSRARLLGEYADEALNLLDGHFEGLNDFAYQTARTYTREFHDVFTRSFVGEMRRTGEHGQRVHPEVMLRKALASDADATAIRLEELDDATRFLEKAMSNDDVAKAVHAAKIDYDPEQAMAVMLDAQERMLRIVMTESIDPLTGRANARRLADFVRKNDDLLTKRMPGLKDDLQRVIESEVALKEMEKNIPKHGTPEFVPPGLAIDIDQAILSAKLAGVDRPDKVIHTILSSASPEKGLSSLAKMVRNDPGATKGLQRVVLSSLGDSLEVRIEKLNSPMGPGLPTLLDSMKTHGIVDEGTYRNMKKVIGEYEKFMAVAETHKTVPLPGETETVTTLITAFFSRLTGQRILHETGAAPGGAGAISAYSAVSRISQKILDKMPTERVIKALERAMLDKTFADDLMKDMSKLTDKEAYRLMGRVHGYLIQAGLIPVIREEDDTMANRGIRQ